MRISWQLPIILVAACAPTQTNTPGSRPASSPVSSSRPASMPGAASMPSAPDSAGPTAAGPVAADWVAARVGDARARMTSKGALIVARAIEAHGGLTKWLSSGTIAFTFNYQPLGNPARQMHTRSRVDLWRSRAIQQELGEGADARLAFDGKLAWITPGPKAFPTPARFWATTPYYFVGMPFVLADPGVRFEQLEDLTLDGRTYHAVKATYAPGTGDSPDDYYILYVDTQTFQVGALRYIVAYPGFFKKGKHTPEKLMRYTDFTAVDGLQFAGRLDTYEYGEAGPGKKVTSISVSDVKLGESIPGSDFEAPEGAVVTDTL